MTQTSNRLFDELARLMTDAANVAQGVRREASTAFRSQADRLITDLDLVRREDFDAVKEMASRARAENGLPRSDGARRNSPLSGKARNCRRRGGEPAKRCKPNAAARAATGGE
jgi:hypothetical protein